MWLTRNEMIGVLSCYVVANPAQRDDYVENIVWDSRQVLPGCAFLAIPGEKVDGNSFITQAIDAGAKFIIATTRPSQDIIDKAQSLDVAVVVVEDYQQALWQLASYYRERLNAHIIGISGSTGKTTTKDMIATVCSAQFITTATAANQNNELGVPNTVLSASMDTEALIVEMGMRGLGQLEELCSFVCPHIGVLTNIGTAHEELLGSQTNIAKAKSELIAALPSKTGIAILNGDDPFTSKIREFAATESSDVAVLLYGMNEHCNVRAVNVEFDADGKPSFDIVFPNGRSGHVDLPMTGQHNVMNALAAASVGYALDMPVERICNALGKTQTSSMRQELLTRADGARIINDAYNANPDSMRASISTMALMACGGQRIAVLGDMGELGENEVRAHFSVGFYAAQNNVDVLVCVGLLSHHMAAGAIEAGMPRGQVIECSDVADALQVLEGMVCSDGIVLVKASRFMHLEQIVKELVD